MCSIPRDSKGSYKWKALPDGRYLIEWWERGKRKREAAGLTVADALNAARRRRHALEGKKLGIEAYVISEEEPKRLPLYLAVKRYLDVVEELKKPNTLRRYRSVLKRFVEFFSNKTTILCEGRNYGKQGTESSIFGPFDDGELRIILRSSRLRVAGADGNRFTMNRASPVMRRFSSSAEPFQVVICHPPCRSLFVSSPSWPAHRCSSYSD